MIKVPIDLHIGKVRVIILKKATDTQTDRQRDRPTNQHSDLYGLGRLEDGLG